MMPAKSIYIEYLALMRLIITLKLKLNTVLNVRSRKIMPLYPRNFANNKTYSCENNSPIMRAYPHATVDLACFPQPNTV
jgi:hypothetical protein